MQYQEVKAGVGEDQEVTLEVGGRSDSLGKVLPRGSADGTLIWSRDMGDYGDNETSVKGSACEFPATVHM